MGKSGPRVPNPKIIDSWHLKSRTRILLESFLTLAFWSGFLYLLTPVVTLILWVLGVQIAYTELIGVPGPHGVDQDHQERRLHNFYRRLMYYGLGLLQLPVVPDPGGTAQQPGEDLFR